MSTIIAYPVTPAMGTREALNAMLSHVATHDSLGYESSFVQRANHSALLADFDGIVVPVWENMATVLKVAPIVSDSANLAYLCEVLIGLCDDYPLYNDEALSNLIDEELREYVDMARDSDSPSVESIMNAIYELGDFDYNDGGVCIFIAEDDWERAVSYARANPIAE